eukprot:CAMPEP_0118979310 /NCGR_PEP_ID=MMETSP1173-20130426/25676_1 /TAXON_ID=1034831 /ORGANISM="Rhizochromulina marina cf, Strain CCMP1243" /LENGTH=259 /DNA_ID=CAMNT_0006929567 /DNA_START=9 /DNA_END=785 /DNA_ORIENTATION=-
MPKQTREALETLLESGYTTVAATRIIYGKLKKTDGCDIDPRRWMEELATGSAQSTTCLPILGPSAAQVGGGLTLLTRLTLVPEEPDDVPSIQSHKIAETYNVVAIQPTSQRTWELACEQHGVDVVSLDCTQRLRFHITRKQVDAALEKGAKFELLYGQAMKDPSAFRFLVSTARQLTHLTRGKHVIMSSGSSDAVYLRSPHDVLNLAALLDITRSGSFGCLREEPAWAVAHGRARNLVEGTVDRVLRANTAEGGVAGEV